MTVLLKVEHIGKTFGGLQALQDLSLELSAGEVLGLIGPNGSGKTTTINLLTGVLPCSSGAFAMEGRPLAGLKPEEIVRRGIARTFQNLRLFATHSVLDNVRAAQTVNCRSVWTRYTALPNAEERHLRSEAQDLLDRFGLATRTHDSAGSLSYGEKKRLEMARAMAMKPRVLLLDEPAAGMNAVELEGLIALIRAISDTGCAVLLVEHHMKLIMQVCDRIAVLNFGQKIAEGVPAQIARDPQVISAYLGKPH